jgi:hypothetical protein
MSRRHVREDSTDTTDTDSSTGRHEVARTDSQPEEAHQRFGGINWGASFFGLLVAIALTVLLSSIVAAIASAIGNNANLTQNQAQRNAGAIGIGAAIALVVVLLIAYYAGGYVAGRMSRFDGGRQGVGVWVFGLVMTLVAVALGWIFGDQYNVMDRVNLPRLPVPTSDATTGGIVTGLVILFGTLLTAMLGGRVGRRYHNKVDRAVGY